MQILVDLAERGGAAKNPASAPPAPIEVTTSLTRPGRPFLPLAERDLAPALREAASRLPTRAGAQVLMLAECPLPVGVPDLLAVVADINALRTRSAADVPPLLAQQEARLASVCGLARPASLQHLASAGGISTGHARRIVAVLENKGALLSRGTGWVRHPALMPIGRTYAIEAKVDNWRAGMAQCLRYATFADAAALTVGAISQRSAANAIERAREYGIGLFLHGTWSVRPRISRLPPSRRLWVSEHIVAALTRS